jgi:hypothetical protein
MLIRVWLLGFASLLLLGGCVEQARGVRVGTPAPRLASDAEVRRSDLTPKDAADRYRQVGTVCLSRSGGAGDLDDEARKLGGNLVIPIGTCVNGLRRTMEEGTEYGVYVMPR